MTKTFMRADKKLLEEIKKMKQSKKDSYADVIRRLINKEKEVKF